MNKATNGPTHDTVASGLVRPKSALPTLPSLATPPLVANGLIVSVLLMEKHVLQALGIAGGYLVGLIVYSALHYFTENVFGLFVSRSPSGSTPLPGNMMLFGAFEGGKFILVAVLMYLMIALWHFSIAAFVAGFLITQICVSVSVLNRLSRTKITD